MRRFIFALVLFTVSYTRYVSAESEHHQRAAVLAVAQTMLEAINRDDRATMAGLFLNEGLFISSRILEGQPSYTVTDKEEIKSGKSSVKLLERGFNPEVRISGNMAMVWMPYDIYIDDKWSHCGIDLLTMLYVADSWKLTTFQYSVLQPPACQKHPSERAG